MINININQDFQKTVVVNTASMPWLPSPMPGVQRQPLERAAAESGRVTSVVRYAAGSKFTQHSHPHGEEIFVLDGVFSDENGDYPAGSYLRHPPQSAHAPFSQQGCTLLVKLDQFAADDTKWVNINTSQQPWQPYQSDQPSHSEPDSLHSSLRHGTKDGMQDSLQIMPLHTHGHEHVALLKGSAGACFKMHKQFGGEEIFVLQGVFRDEHGQHPVGTWLRKPHGSQHHLFLQNKNVQKEAVQIETIQEKIMKEETIIWLKTGHLPR